MTTNVTDRRTDDMRSQDRVLHYSASRGKMQLVLSHDNGVIVSNGHQSNAASGGSSKCDVVVLTIAVADSSFLGAEFHRCRIHVHSSWSKIGARQSCKSEISGDIARWNSSLSSCGLWSHQHVFIISAPNGINSSIVITRKPSYAKLNARQHCVSLSCLCNSLTQIVSRPYLPNPCEYLHNPYIARNYIHRTTFPSVM